MEKERWLLWLDGLVDLKQGNEDREKRQHGQEERERRRETS